MATNPQVALLLKVFDQAFGGAAWHGTPLGGSLRGLSWQDALKRPRAGRHSIWEVALHTAYWKCMVRRRLTRDASVEFPRSPANFPAVPKQPSAALWKKDVALLKREHRLLRDVIAGFPASRLKQKAWKSRWTNEASIYGIASHDLYHAGQIQLVKQLI